MGVAFVVVGVLAGLVIGWLAAQQKAAARVAAEREARAAAEAQAAAAMASEREARVAAETRLEETKKQAQAQRGLLEEARAQLSDSFKALSSDALQANSQVFVDRGEADVGAAERGVEAI